MSNKREIYLRKGTEILELEESVEEGNSIDESKHNSLIGNIIDTIFDVVIFMAKITIVLVIGIIVLFIIIALTT